MRRIPNRDDGIQIMVQRLDAALEFAPARVIAFISARSGEGTSTVARDYVHALSEIVEHQILLIDAGVFDQKYYATHHADPKVTIADTLAAGLALAEAAHSWGPHVSFARWAGQGRNRNASALLNDDAFWKNLREAYGTVVIDAPSLKESSEGISLAARADATVIVVEAETTRQPVIENLRDALAAAGAKTIGIIMNKRRYYIPAKVYRNM